MVVRRGEFVVEVASGNVLTDEVDPALLVIDIVDRNDVRVIAEPPHRFRFPANAYEVEPFTLDERDRQVDRLANLMDIRVLPRENGSISIFTESGTSLFDGIATKFQFDGRGAITPDTLYSTDPTQRGVGTIVATSQNGFSFDLLQDGVIRSGEIAAYTALRDDLLVEAQAQLDEFASALALTLSSINTSGTAVTSGASAGFEADISAMISGDRISLDVLDTASGNTQTYTFIRVDDPSQLPLAANVTANPNDLVFGIDFSGGLAGAVAAMDAAIGVDTGEIGACRVGRGRKIAGGRVAVDATNDDWLARGRLAGIGPA